MCEPKHPAMSVPRESAAFPQADSRHHSDVGRPMTHPSHAVKTLPNQEWSQRVGAGGAIPRVKGKALTEPVAAASTT